MLTIIETHPVQYHAPVYKQLQDLGIPITVVYGSDFSVIGYKDSEFGESFAWDTDLLSGYESFFLSQINREKISNFEGVTANGLEQVLKKLKPKAILITGYNHRLYRAAFCAAWKLKYPILFRAETTDHALSRNFVKGWLRNKALSLLYQTCTKLLYIGRNSLLHYQNLVSSEDKLIFSPYCVDIKSFEIDKNNRNVLRNKTRKNLGITKTKIVLLFSGKLSYRKGVDLILLATQKLPKQIQKKLVILFLGNGELREKLEKQAKYLEDIQVYFLGFQNQTKLSCYYHAADLFILPSRYSETWGLVVNEALHHGLPCIVSQAVGCAPDLIKPNITGNIFITNSVDSLAMTIEKSLFLLNFPETKERCRLQVSNYSVEKAAEGIANAYNFIK